MTTTSIIILNLLLVLGLFMALATVMSTAHRVAGQRRHGRRFDLEPVHEEPELERAA